MSHFSVAVFTEPNGKMVDELLAPYQENNMGDCPKEYLEFKNIEDEYKEEYENDGIEMVKLPDGKLVFSWDDIFRKKGEIGFGSSTHEVPEEYERVYVKHKDRYNSFESFIEDWAGYEKDEETGIYGYWENPNKKWDYWRIGGRFRGLIKAENGELGDKAWELSERDDRNGYFDSAQIKDLVFKPDMKAYDKAIKEWELLVENQSPVTEDDEEIKKWSFYKPQYYIDRYKNKETYAKIKSEFKTYSVVLPDGKWYEKGQMGWWGCSSETGEESLDWDLHYKERFIDTANPEWTLTVVDCHI